MRSLCLAVALVGWVVAAWYALPGGEELRRQLAKEVEEGSHHLGETRGLVNLISLEDLDALISSQSGKKGDPPPELPLEHTGGERVELPLEDTGGERVELPLEDTLRLRKAGAILKERLILRVWLHNHQLLHTAKTLGALGVTSLEDAYWFEEDLTHKIGGKSAALWNAARTALPQGPQDLKLLKTLLWETAINNQAGWNTWGTMLLVTLSALGFMAVTSLCPQVRDAKNTILNYLGGNTQPNYTLEFEWKDPAPVGNTLCFKIKFWDRLSPGVPLAPPSSLRIEIKRGEKPVASLIEVTDQNERSVKFSVRKSGEYAIHVTTENGPIKNSPFLKTFLPSDIDPEETVLLKQTSNLVCLQGNSFSISILPKDTFQNLCDPQHLNLNLFNTSFQRLDGPVGLPPWSQFSQSSSTPLASPTVTLELRFPSAGVFSGRLCYGDRLIQQGRFDVFVLSREEAANVQKNVAGKSNQSVYEGRLLDSGKMGKVFLSLTSKQLVIKEYFWKLLPLRVAGFRISPNSKLEYLPANNQWETPRLVMDDGAQPPLTIAIKEAKIIVATFTHFLLRNIGGSETFTDKQEHFYKELRELHRKHPRDKITLKITRENIIESTWKATKSLSTQDWCRNFEINFVGEQGVDWGGLRREWIEQTCTRFFESGNGVGMFISLGESSLVHPNPNSRWKPKHFEMAGRMVGKCLYESSLGATYRQMVKAKFTRSFLAQLVGLRAAFKHFEKDDPELYLRKVKFILDNDVTGLELSFSEEDYDHLGKLVKTIDLIPEGSKTEVTNSNKLSYLNSLAQYRLTTRVKPLIEAFLRGLHELVPDELLSIFDENELELLMCGTSEYSVDELRSHHSINDHSSQFKKVLDWFWTAVGNMTEEEKARLLQFTTGCSLLPPGGFKELTPIFQITSAPSQRVLPTAHTCFNQICLPDHPDFEAFEKALRIAIYEGAEGFGLV